MADLESVLADVSYLMAMERSKNPGSKVIKRFTLPDPSVHCVVHCYLLQNGLYSFEKIYTQRMGAYYLDRFIPQTCPLLGFLKAIISYERTASPDLRRRKAKEIYDRFIFADMLAMSANLPKQVIEEVSSLLRSGECPPLLFHDIKSSLYTKLNNQYMREFAKSSPYTRFCQWKYQELVVPEQISLGDFSVHRIIGRGGFGEVYGCRKDNTGKMFALKLLDKKRIKVKKGEHLALNERNMLAKVNSPFVVNLYYAFQTSNKLCFILDLMNGGDLHYHLTQHGVFNEQEVLFYAAELILALEHVHAQSIAYRDLKPSNILLDEVGHLRLSDLGLACEYKEHQPSSSVGTHGYMAPEVIRKGVHYTFTADWFSLGCVLYKLLRGHGPFRSQHAKNKDEIDQLTLTKDVQLPPSVSPELTELILGLLEKDPGRRLACRGRGSEELKELAFFQHTNWEDVLNKKLSPPLIPPKGEVNAADAFDIGNFDDEDTKGIRMGDEDQRMYRKFNLLVSDRWQAEMMEGIFDTVNAERDKIESRERSRRQSSSYDPDVMKGDLVLQGYGFKASGLISHWQKKFFALYPNRLEWADNIAQMPRANVLPFDTSTLVDEKEQKGLPAIRIQPIGSRKDHTLRFDAGFEQNMWLEQLKYVVLKSEAVLPRQMRSNASDSSLQHRKLAVSTSLPILK